MIEKIEFRNFKVLRDTTLELGRFTLLVGPNGSGKSTALQAFAAVAEPEKFPYTSIVSVGQTGDVVVRVSWADATVGKQLTTVWDPANKNLQLRRRAAIPRNELSAHQSDKELRGQLAAVRTYSFDSDAIINPVQIRPDLELGKDGGGLAGVLDTLGDEEPERFEAVNEQLCRWAPEYDRILFDKAGPGQKVLAVRTAGGHKIAAKDLSHGTLFAIAILTIAYSPHPPPLIGIEEPDRGIHPRLMRDVQEALYRLAYPENYGENRPSVQVIATTHSPYLLDLFKDHPEEVVIAEKQGSEATFQRLADRADIHEILEDASLGEIWYSGVLGGVPAGT